MEWYLMLDIIDILMLEHKRSLALSCVRLQLGNLIVILKENIEISQLIFLKDLTQSIYIVMNKVHKYFFINMLYLKIIKFIQAI